MSLIKNDNVLFYKKVLFYNVEKQRYASEAGGQRELFYFESRGRMCYS